MSISPNAPVARFGRWLDGLRTFDFVILLVVAPALGLASVVGPSSGFQTVYPGGIMRNSVENMAVGRTILCLFGVGVLVALLSRRLGVWAASTVMASYALWLLSEFASGADGHNLLPFEVGLYLLLTAFAMSGAALVSLVRQPRA